MKKGRVQGAVMSKEAESERRYTGLGVSDGIAVARVCFFREERLKNVPIFTVSAAEVDREIVRFGEAVREAAEKLDAHREAVAGRVGPEEAEILFAQGMILQDPTLSSRVCHEIRSKRLNAEAAVTQVLDAYAARLEKVDDSYLRERCADIVEVKQRLLGVLREITPGLQCGDNDSCQEGRSRIIVAEELTPSLTLELDPDRTLGFVTERGGQTTHAAILARALGIPAVVGIEGVCDRVSCGTRVIVNGTSGEIVVSPTEETLSGVRSAATGGPREPETNPMSNGLTVMANIILASDLEDAEAVAADGIGLYRTEFEVMAANRLLDEDEQAERYRAVVRRMKGKPVQFRLFDLGSDKPFPSFTLAEEENPALGWRGARLLLGRPDLLAPQARALARASLDGPVRILYPMIAHRDQFLALKGEVTRAIAGAPKGLIEHGVMFEIPSACLQAKELFEVADFGSVGSNDLVQYLFAVDRNNDRVARDYDPDRPVFWALLRAMADAADEAGRPLSLCGELAGDPRYTGKIMEAGIRLVSVSARLIPAIRRAARTAGSGIAA